MQQEQMPQGFGYQGDEQITITAKEFIKLKSAVEQGIRSTIVNYLPEVTNWIEVATSNQVESPTLEQIQNGEVVMVTNRESTFSPNNVKTFFSDKLSMDMVEGQELMAAIHQRNIETGVAKSFQTLKELSEGLAKNEN
jgi:hypothetical protein